MGMSQYDRIDIKLVECARELENKKMKERKAIEEITYAFSELLSHIDKVDSGDSLGREKEELEKFFKKMRKIKKTFK